MAQSHSCCQSDGSGDTHPLLKDASPKVTVLQVTVAHVIPQIELPANSLESLNQSSTLWLDHLPGETPPGTTVLRI